MGERKKVTEVTGPTYNSTYTTQGAVLTHGSDSASRARTYTPAPACAQRGLSGDPVTSVTFSPAAFIGSVLDLMGSTRSGKKLQCPGHALDGEHSHALAFSDSDGKPLLYCHAGCDLDKILGGLRLHRVNLRVAPLMTPDEWHEVMLGGATFPPAKTVSGGLAQRGYRFEAEHPYAAADDPRREVAWKMRYRHTSGTKEIRWESLNPGGERVPGLLGRRQVDLALYKQHDLGPAIGSGETIVLVESESSVDALNKAGVYATTWCGGAADPPLEQIAKVLVRTIALLVPDNDEAGLACAEKIVAHALPTVRVQLGETGEDARDILAKKGPQWFR